LKKEGIKLQNFRPKGDCFSLINMCRDFKEPVLPALISIGIILEPTAIK